jgi:hypothetical protein
MSKNLPDAPRPWKSSETSIVVKIRECCPLKRMMEEDDGIG